MEYIKVMRKLQRVYMLEPAGSHGVWGLDDYHCLTFVFGAAQLSDHPSITPSSIHDEEVLAEESQDYLYLEGIQYIRKIKHTAPFAETSPMLNDISGMPGGWNKVCLGLTRLFYGEVMCKLPVVQHLRFGSLLPCTWAISVDAASVGAHSTSTVPSTAHRIDMDSVATKAPWSK